MDMEKYEFLSHTADAKFVAYGRDLGEAFSNAAVAMFSVMVKPDIVESRIKKRVTFEAENIESLLYDWLESLLVLLDSENFILSSVESIKILETDKGYVLDACFLGDSINDNYKPEGFVKAVTYNDMEIKEKEGIWCLTVVVDR
ncbi:MAG: archease [archaeon]|nr:archease [archaeon]